MQQEIRRKPSIEVVHGAPTQLEDFLAWAARRPREEGRYELSNGVVTRTMINVTRAHARICTNVVLELGRLLDQNRYFIATADFAVDTGVGSRGPDIVVDEAHLDRRSLATDAPVFLAEVLSPSSTALDFTTKLREYTGIASLREYLICSQDSVRVWLWSRQADGSWPEDPETIEGRESKVPLAGLGAALDMGAIYRGIADIE